MCNGTEMSYARTVAKAQNIVSNKWFATYRERWLDELSPGRDVDCMMCARIGFGVKVVLVDLLDKLRVMRHE